MLVNGAQNMAKSKKRNNTVGATAKMKELSGATLVCGLFVSAHLATAKVQQLLAKTKKGCVTKVVELLIFSQVLFNFTLWHNLKMQRVNPFKT